MHPLPSLSVVALTFTILPLMAAAQSFSYGPRNTDFPPAFPEQTRAPLIDSGVALKVETLARGWNALGESPPFPMAKAGL